MNISVVVIDGGNRNRIDSMEFDSKDGRGALNYIRENENNGHMIIASEGKRVIYHSL